MVALPNVRFFRDLSKAEGHPENLSRIDWAALHQRGHQRCINRKAAPVSRAEQGPRLPRRRALSEHFNFPEFQEPVFGLYSEMSVVILDAGRGCDQQPVELYAQGFALAVIS